MDVDAYLEQLYREGCRNDEAAVSRDGMMLNITPSTGKFLDVLVRDAQPTRILELGTSNGYSTLWLARAAAAVGATVDSVDASRSKVQSAEANLAACSLTETVTLHHGDGGDFLRQSDDDRYDFVFLDSDRSRYQDWSSDLIGVLRFGLLVVDNAVSHAGEMVEFRRTLSQEFGLSVVVLPIGKGQMVVQDAASAGQRTT
ncbi:N5-glutamine S-adenosyl-L-methionine-dependent methyltransferase [Stieleria neptunia]|uniref:N5-glutamine S-adenosyl-L-methionine-dependent methyltransferase n=1 Tax=Stieleria neptunia TaxID=2527979 RepID=A0A518HWA8_9BACT|nr:class I SAM-dependent methyltransferase [Stieleria neptunia]QDV45139.1 N5-glutamine S-adenosyl-L-methionine-dependent methyltransferase [Stieleria neptunia]